MTSKKTDGEIKVLKGLKKTRVRKRRTFLAKDKHARYKLVHKTKTHKGL